MFLSKKGGERFLDGIGGEKLFLSSLFDLCRWHVRSYWNQYVSYFLIATFKDERRDDGEGGGRQARE